MFFSSFKKKVSEAKIEFHHKLNFLEPEQIFVPNKEVKPIKTKALPEDSSLNKYDGHKKDIQKNQQENEDAAKDLEKAINNVLIKTANAIYTSKLLEKELSGLYKNIEVFEKSIGNLAEIFRQADANLSLLEMYAENEHQFKLKTELGDKLI